MGRIKTKFVKSNTKKLMNLHGEKFSGDFNKNKTIVGNYTVMQSKKMRNVIAGYVTRLKKKE
jgi:small subunit ribosomal protein S17e